MTEAAQEIGTTIALAARLARVELPRRPRLVPWIEDLELGDGRLQLRAADFAYTFRHPVLAGAYRSVAPLLDGTRTVEEIAGDDGAILFVLKLLRANGVLQPGGDPWDPELAFLSHSASDAGAARAALRQARVEVMGDGSIAAAVEGAMRSLGVEPVEDEAELVIACADSPAFAFFDDVNARCLESGTRWLRVALVGATAQLGPTVIPRESACFTCLDTRLGSHDPDGDEGSLAPLESALAAEAALETMRIVTGIAPPATIGRFYELDAASPVRVGHDVLKVPRCTSCGRGRPAREPWDGAS
jgi:hypothetical protein